MPRWRDDLGFGVWGCKENSHDWTVDGLRDAFLRVLDGNSESVALLERAQYFAAQQKEKGRDVAGRIIAKIAGTGT